jgi:hypothetical protein
VFSFHSLVPRFREGLKKRRIGTSLELKKN